MGIPFTERILKPYWLAIIAGLFAFLLYANTIPNYYAIDDMAVITATPDGGEALGYYRPLPLATYAVEQKLWGDNPHASHFVNALLYGVTGWLLCIVLFQMLAGHSVLFAFVTSLLFIAHPVHTEVVANIKSRDELLQFLCFISAVYFLLRVDKQNLLWLLASCCFYYLALLSKETAIAGMLLVPGILFFTTNLSNADILKRTGMFVVVFILFLFQKQIAMGNAIAAETNDIVGFPYAGTGLQLSTAFTNMWWYIKLLVLPYPLSYNYNYNQVPATGWASVTTILGLLLVVLGAVIIVYKAKDKSLSAFGLFMLFAALVPAMGFVLLKGGTMAERFLYEPVLGYSLLLCWCLFKTLKLPLSSNNKMPPPNIFKWVAPVVILMLYSFATVIRNTHWKDDLAISSHDVEVVPNSCQVHLHYGKKLIDLGVAEADAEKKKEYFEKGVAQLQAAVAIYPKYARAYFKLGYAYQMLQPNADSAIYYYRRAIDEAPGYAIAYKNLGLQYAGIGRTQLASQYLQKAMEIDPSITGVAEILSNLNTKPVAVTVTGDTTSFAYYSSAGVALAKEKKLDNALANFKRALELQPESLEALVNIATCYGMMSNYAKSEEYLLKAEKLQPDSRIVLQNLMILYRVTGNKVKEEEYSRKVQSI